MTVKLFKLLETNKRDTIGTAIFKDAAQTYIKGVLAGAVGLGVLAFGVKKLSGDDELLKKEEEDINQKLEDNWDEIEKEAQKQIELLDSI